VAVHTHQNYVSPTASACSLPVGYARLFKLLKWASFVQRMPFSKFRERIHNADTVRFRDTISNGGYVQPLFVREFVDVSK